MKNIFDHGFALQLRGRPNLPTDSFRFVCNVLQELGKMCYGLSAYFTRLSRVSTGQVINCSITEIYLSMHDGGLLSISSSYGSAKSPVGNLDLVLASSYIWPRG